MKTVVFFCGYFLPHLGGIERYIDNLSKQFVKNGIKVIIVSSNFDNAANYEIIDNIIQIRIPIYNAFKNRYPIPRKNREYRHLIKKLDDFDISAIIVNTRFHLTSHIGAKYGKKKNIPVYLIEHGSNYVTLDNKFIDFFANRYEDFLTFKIKKYVKNFYGVSNVSSEWIKKFHIKANGTWYNSINTDQKIPTRKKHNSINFMYAGRLIKQKGVENILEAFRKLLNINKNIHLFIAGDGPELNHYKNKYSNENIEFLGKLNYEELSHYYSLSDIFLYPPLWPEGLPTSILEAGLMGCCVIGTSQGGIKEIISDKKNGLIAGNDMQSLYECMKTLCDNKNLINKYSNELKKSIKKKFSWNINAKKIARDIGVLDEK